MNNLRYAILFLCLVALPRAASAHGELLIRIAALTRQIEAATNNPARLYLLRGELYREDKNWEAAAGDYTRAEQLAPNLVGVDFCRATMLADSGQPQAARRLFDQIVLRCPTDGQALIGRARVLERLGESQASVTDYRRGLELLPDPDPGCYLGLARAFVAVGQTNQALRALDDGIRKFGPILPLQAYALDLELERNNHDAALARLDTILERALRKENWLTRRGDILLAAGRQAEARKSFEAALGAIKTLPLRLQQNPPMLNLQARINSALAGIAFTNAPAMGKMLETSLSSSQSGPGFAARRPW